MTRLAINISIPGQAEEKVSLIEGSLMVGTLSSNQVVLRAQDVEPIHAMFEDVGGKDWVIADLGSQAGIFINGAKVDVESKISVGDEITIGSSKIIVIEEVAELPPPPPAIDLNSVATEASPTAPSAPLSGQAPSEMSEQTSSNQEIRQTMKAEVPDDAERRSREQLFSPRSARPSGSFLECVSYWQDTVLDIELYHPKDNEFRTVIVGDEKGAHFPAGGEKNIKNYPMANFTGSDSFRVRLVKGMTARVRKGGKVSKVEGPTKLTLGKRDLVHISHGAIKYFLLFVRPPKLNIPRKRPGDPMFNMIASMAALIYLLTVPFLIITDPKPEKNEEEQFWELVKTPTKDKKPEPVKKQIVKPKPKKKMVDIKKKSKNKKPPKIVKKKVVKPKKPKQVAKVKQPKPTKNPVKKSNNISEKFQKKSANTKQNNGGKNNKKGKSGGMAKGRGKPNFKLVGPKTNSNNKLTGGNRGAGNNRRGGARKGRGKVSVKGVEGKNNKRASGVNLKKLGFGSGLALNKKGAGAIRGFKSTVGGSGGGSGSAARTTGMGGPGSRGSIGISGSGGAGNFGGGTGGSGSGQGGNGGLGGSGLGKGFGRGNGSGGRGRPQISTPRGGIVASEGLTDQQIKSVIQANLNQIRYCYETLLRRSKNASGKVKARFIVSSSGRVSSASIVGGTLRDTTLDGCISSKIKRWKFDKPRGGAAVTVTYPFVFTPS